jgi:branched-subunit amino acid transport protein
MTFSLGIVMMAALTYAIRLGGLLLPGARLAGPIGRFLSLIPVAVFAALIVTGLPGATAYDSAWRIGAALVTGGLVAWRGSFGLGVLVGFAAYLAARQTIGG